MGAFALSTVLPASPPLTALKTTSGSSPARVASDQRFAHGGDVAGDHDLIGQFGHVARAHRAGERDAGAHFCRIGTTLSKACWSPPTMMASVPSMAFGSPPLTGASTKPTLFAAQAAAIFCETSGLMELMSTTMRAGARAFENAARRRGPPRQRRVHRAAW